VADAGARITVALVDDQPLFRAGIRMLIESQEDMELTGEAGDGEEAVTLATERRPDVMLMDLRMPVLDGVEATRRIVQHATAAGTDKPKIIALTTFNRDQAVVQAVQAGASGYLLKERGTGIPAGRHPHRSLRLLRHRPRIHPLPLRTCRPHRSRYRSGPVRT
jgi:DNA-binding NarL/FixJ family response regulator